MAFKQGLFQKSYIFTFFDILPILRSHNDGSLYRKSDNFVLIFSANWKGNPLEKKGGGGIHIISNLKLSESKNSNQIPKFNTKSSLFPNNKELIYKRVDSIEKSVERSRLVLGHRLRDTRTSREPSPRSG